MTDVGKFVAALEQSGVRLRLNDGRIAYEGPPAALTSAVLAELKHRKAEVVEFLEARAANCYLAPIKPQGPAEWYPASAAQERLHAVQQLDPASVAYNLPAVYRLEGPLQHARLEKAFRSVIAAHDVFRTRFAVRDGRIVQLVAEHCDWSLGRDEREFESAEEMQRTFLAPFSLDQAPLLRAVVARRRAGGHFLFCDLHHTVADGWSGSIFFTALKAAYLGEPLTRPPLRYADFACWERALETRGLLAAQRTFWAGQLAEPRPCLNLVPDLPRPRTLSSAGDVAYFRFSPAQTEALRRLHDERGATLYMAVLALVKIFLHRLTGDEDLIVGIPASGRDHPDLAPIVGLFVNTVPVRTRPAREKSVHAFLAEVKDQCIAALENQRLPFDQMIGDVAHDTSHHPLFDVMCLLEGGRQTSDTWDDIVVHTHRWENRSARYDLNFVFLDLGTELELRLEYRTTLFRRETIERLGRMLSTVLDAMVESGERRLADIPLLAAEDRKQLLTDFNATAAEYPRAATVDALFAAQADQTPEAVAIVDGDTILTYRALAERAAAIAAELAAAGVTAGELVGIHADRSWQMIAAMLGALQVGAAYLPLDPGLPAGRIAYMVRDGAVGVVLAQGEKPAELAFDGRWLRIEAAAAPATGARPARRAAGRPDDVAYVMYTSGSTGLPKGVLVPHRGIVRLVRNTDYVTFQSGDRILQTGSVAFDAATFENWGALLNGLTLYFSPREILLDPAELDAFLAKHGITVLWLTSSLFNQLVAERPAMFRGLRELIIGGDALSPSHVALVQTHCPGLVVVNGYGPTESTTFAVCHRLTATEPAAIPIGRPIRNTRAYILDRTGAPAPIGSRGELCIGGDGLARGYLNAPELTAEKFTTLPGSGDERIYRTGDQARWRADGVIDFLGRIDEQVKVNGYRIELGEIEKSLCACENVKGAVVLKAPVEGGLFELVAFVETTVAIDVAALRARLFGLLPSYMVPAAVIAVEQIPLKHTGKVDREKLLAFRRAAAAAPAEAVTEQEARVIAVWESLLGRTGVRASDDFFALGGNSLKAIRMLSRLREQCGLDVSIRQLFAAPTVKGLIESAAAGESLAPRLAPPATVATGPQRASSNQRRLYVLQTVAPDSVTYNVPTALAFSERLDFERLRAAIDGVVQRHEALRTSFAMVDGILMQQVAERPASAFALGPEMARPDGTVLRSLVQPFDLAAAPLLRARAGHLATGGTWLFVDVHHIAADGASLDLILRELAALYRGEELPPVEYQYRHYATHEELWLGDGTFTASERYWREQFATRPPVARLRYDAPAPVVPDHRGDSIRFKLGGADYQAIQEFCREQGMTSYMFFYAALSLLLARVGGEDDVVVGCPVLGRPTAEAQRIVGMFANTIALRIRPQADKKISAYLAEARERCVAGFEHQTYPFESVVAGVPGAGESDRNPLFDVMFSSLNLDLHAPAFARDLQLVPLDTAKAKFDLSLTLAEAGDAFHLEWRYRTARFKRFTIEWIESALRSVCLGLVANRDGWLRDISLLGAAEFETVAALGRGPVVARAQASVVTLFEEVCAQQPESIALVYQDRRITYAELEEASRRVALQLLAHGVGPDELVPVMARPSQAFVVAILGVLRAGAAYLPISPTQPANRVQSILADARASIVLTGPGAPAALPFDGKALAVDDLCERPANADIVAAARGDLAYAIFTSGSTGRPKGVLVRHTGLANLAQAQIACAGIGPADHVLQFANIEFDASVKEIFTTLLAGATLCVYDRDEHFSIPALQRFLLENRVTMASLSPSLLRRLPAAELPDLRVVMSMGEACTPDVVSLWGQGRRLLNGYGPSEATVGASYSVLSPADAEITIGRPFANVQLFIVDQAGQALPAGAIGEICVAGAGLGAGYLNQPALTADRFRVAAFDSSLALYRTGDLGQWGEDGRLRYLGRVDDQVKIRGNRVELKEIEATLAALAGVREAAVVPLGSGSNHETLAAFVVTAQPLDRAEAKRVLRERLPGYMVPEFIAEVEKLPLTVNGKIDREALRRSHAAIQERTPVRELRGEWERTVAAAWSEVLKTARVDPEQNFFEAGGSSVTLLDVHHRLARQVGEFPVAKLFQHPTVESLASYLAGRNATAAPAAAKPFLQPAAPVSNRLHQRRAKLQPAGGRS